MYEFRKDAIYSVGVFKSCKLPEVTELQGSLWNTVGFFGGGNSDIGRREGTLEGG